MGINYSALRAKEWEARIRELEPKLLTKHVKAISIELTKVDQARANLYTVLIDAGLDVATLEEQVNKLWAERAWVSRQRSAKICQSDGRRTFPVSRHCESGRD